MIQFTNNGIQTKTLREIYAELEAQYKQAYGITNEIAQDSSDGQKIGIEAKAIADFQELAVAIDNSFDPDFAEGLALFKILKLTGINVRPATQSTWDLEVEASKDFTLPSGYTVKDDNGILWSIDTNTSLTTGINTVTFICNEFGAVEGIAGAEIQQAAPEIEVIEILAPIDATVGSDGETLREIRQRRNRSLENPASSTIGSMFAKVGNVAGVTDIAVYENDTKVDTVDIPANTIWIIAEGGEVAEIAETIIKNKTGGTGLKGSVEGTFVETLPRPNGTNFIFTHTANFDRPTYTPIYINVTATLKNPADFLDIDLIKKELAKAIYYIGEPIRPTELYKFGYNAGNNFVLTDLQISKDSITFTDDLLIANKDEKFTFNVTNIVVTEV